MTAWAETGRKATARPSSSDQRRPTGSIIYLEDVTVDYDGFKALNRLNFYMDYRELRVVIGPNGAGKTTLLDVVSGRVKPARGRLIFGQATDLLPLGIEEIARLGIGRKFQTPSVFVNLSVWENVELSLRRARQGVFATLLTAARTARSETGRRRCSTPSASRRRRDGRPACSRTASGSGSRSAW